MMKKLFLLSFCLLLTQSLWARNPFLITHEEFVHLSEKEKEEVVVQTMELIVELEGRYQHGEIKQVQSSETKEKLIQLFTKLNSFLMSSAYAQANVKDGWSKRGDDFIRLMGKGNRCVYAGWVSTVVENICVHPSRAGKFVTKQGKKVFEPDTQIRNAYKNATASACEGQGVNKITCNPVIFGFAQKSSDKLFCVNAGTGKAHNSSLECMEASLSETTKKGYDSAADRKKDIIASLESNPNIANGVQKYITQACICTDMPQDINKKYHTYMRPHRTCYGLMNMISKTYGQCTSETNSSNQALFSTFDQLNSELINQIKINRSTDRVNSTDQSYDQLVLSQIRPSDYQSLCKNEKPDGDDLDGGGKNNNPNPNAAPGPTGPACKTISCAKKTGENAQGFTCEVEITGLKDIEPVKMSLDAPSTDLGQIEVLLSEVHASFKDSKETISCAIEEENNDDNTIKCSEVTFALEAGKIKATAVYDLGETKVKGEPVWTPATTVFDAKSATFDLPKDAESFQVSLTQELEGKTLSCQGEWKKEAKDDGKDKPTIAPKKDSETPANVKVLGIISKPVEGKMTEVPSVEGYITVWYRKNAQNLDLPKVELKPKKDEKPKPDGKAVDGDTPEKEEPKEGPKEAPKDEKAKVDPNKEKIGEGPSITVPRSVKGDYDVCVELQGKDTIEGGCVKIPKISAPGNNGMRPGGNMRPSHQTAAPLTL